MKIEVFIPCNLNKGNRCLLNLALLFSLLSLSGCLTTENSAPLALSPPVEGNMLLSQNDDNSYQPHYFAQPNIADEMVMNAQAGEQVVALKSNSAAGGRCSFKDRFDRKAVLAYEWDRSRLALDVEGVDPMGGGNDKGFRLEYKLRFQSEKTKKQLCRYKSSWQGLFGSSYNEFFVREDDTAVEEVKGMKKDVLQYIRRAF